MYDPIGRRVDTMGEFADLAFLVLIAWGACVQ
jgi:hypothetical protein